MPSLLFLVIIILVVHDSFGIKTCIPGTDGVHCSHKPRDCQEVQDLGIPESGVYTIWINAGTRLEKPLLVYCDMVTAGGGWTVLQRRGNYSTPNDYFDRDWNTYKDGFGYVKGEFWLGNENMHQLSFQKNYTVRFDLRAASGQEAYAEYSYFRIQNEDNSYRLLIKSYTGNAGGIMGSYNKEKFSTKDRDNDRYNVYNCAQESRGGWWYYDCPEPNINGLRGSGEEHTLAKWRSFDSNNKNRSLEHIEMKIRPLPPK